MKLYSLFHRQNYKFVSGKVGRVEHRERERTKNGRYRNFPLSTFILDACAPATSHYRHNFTIQRWLNFSTEATRYYYFKITSPHQFLSNRLVYSTTRISAVKGNFVSLGSFLPFFSFPLFFFFYLATATKPGNYDEP